MSNKIKKVYLMIYDLGGGHRSTANALKEAIKQRGLPWEVHIIDCFREIFQSSREQYIYNNLVLKKSWAKRVLKSLIVPLFKQQIRLYHYAWLKLLKNYWAKHKPALVISVLPFVNRELSQSLQAVSPGIPLVTVMTDLIDAYPPNFWVGSQERFLICPTQKAFEQARFQGHPKERILKTSGLVINPKFYEPITIDRRVERQRLGLEPDLPTGLVMFGGYSSTTMLQIFRYLEDSPLVNLQLIFICGHNEKLASILRCSESHFPKFVETFTTEVPYYMYLSDFFIGKPGFGSISEALAMKLPVITECNNLTLMHERYNAEWIVENGFGISINNFRHLPQAVAELLNPDNLCCYQAKVAAFNNKAVFEVVEFLEQFGFSVVQQKIVEKQTKSS